MKKAGRKITEKTVQRVVSCACGYNEASCELETISHKDLRIMKAKKKLSKTSNTTWYLISQDFQECFNCTPEN